MTLVAVAALVGLGLAVESGRPSRRAVIVDQLSLTTPNEAFVRRALALRRRAQGSRGS